MTMEVRFPVFKIELKTALYAPVTSLAPDERALRPGSKPFFASAAATSSSVRNSLPAFAADRSRGTSYITNQVPCRSGSPQGVRSEAGAFAVVNVEIVGPKVGADLRRQAVYVTLYALAGMLVYIALRFELVYGAAAVLAVSLSSMWSAPAAPAAPRKTESLGPHSVTVSFVDVTPSTPSATTTKKSITVVLTLTNTTAQLLSSVRVLGSRGDPIDSRSGLDSAIAHVVPPDPSLVASFPPVKPVTVALGPRSSTRVTYSALISR